MAKHSSGRRNFALSTPLILALIAVAIIIAVIIWLFARPDSPTSDSAADADSGSCIEGDLQLPVGGDSTAVASAVSEFNAASHVTRDFCVVASEVDAGAPAATYLFSGTKGEAAAALAKTTRVASGSQDSWPQVGTEAAGVASARGETTLETINFDASSPSAAVALALAGNDEDRAIEAIATSTTESEAFATTESAVIPDGFTFTAIDGARIPVWAITTNAGDGITEDQARAGAEFAAALPAPEELADNAQISSVMARAAEDPSPSAHVLNGPADTLILMDTSSNMDQVVGGTQQSYHTVIGLSLIHI